MKPFHTTIFLWVAGLPCAFGAPVTSSNAPAATTKPAAAAPQTAVAASKETASSQQAADSTPAQTAAESKNADGSPAGAPSEPANKPASPLKRALPKPLKIINNAKAVQEMEHYCKQHPRNWKGFYQLGCEYYKQDANAQAVEAYEKALKLCPWPEQQEPIFYNLGNALFYQAKALKNQRDQKIELLKKSLENYNNALALNKNAKDTIHNIEIVQEVLKRLQQDDNSASNDNNDSPDNNDNPPPPDNNDPNDDAPPPPEQDPEKQDAENILNSEKQNEKALPSDFNQQSGGDDEVEQDW